MTPPRPKAVSVGRDGRPDGFAIAPGFQAFDEPGLSRRLVVSVPTEFLPRVHADLILACERPVGVLYRQLVDRRNPRPRESPPRDFLAIELEPEVVVTAFRECAGLVWYDARCEIWVKGRRGEQVVLDADGLLFGYPDLPAFREVCLAHGLPEGPMTTLADRDYVRHEYLAESDVLEDALIAGLGLSEVPLR